MKTVDTWRDKESNILVALQSRTFNVTGVVPAARGLSLIGEHAAGWLAGSALFTAIDKPRRPQWAGVFAAAFISHAASVVLKRIVRRHRPDDPRIRVGVSTPSRLSFPSSHATSTTATMVAASITTGSPVPLAVVPVMMASRMVLGVHFPTDVIAGAGLGAVTARCIMRRVSRR